MENNSGNSEVKFDTVVKENQDNVSIAKKDLQTILNVLLVISKRGGFILDEYKVVGELFTTLNSLSK